MVSATDAASAVFKKIALSADGLDRQLADLSKRIATPEVDLKDAKFQLGMVNAAKRLDKLSAMVADPSVDVDTAGAQLEILRITAMLDRLDARHVDVSVGVHQSVLSRLGGLLGGGGAAAGGAASAGGGGILSGLPGIGSLGTSGGIAAIGAALAALPFIAQAAAGGIVTALGGGLIGVGVIAAMRLNKVKASFRDLTKSADSNFKDIGRSFAPAMESIFRHVARLFGTLAPVIKSLAGPFKIFSDALLNAFMQPAVTRSLQAVATAFGDILKALAPQLAGDIGAIAAGITNIAQAVSANPKAFADFISFLFKIAGGALDIISSLTRVANWIEAHWNVVKWVAFPVITAVTEVVKHWGTLRHETALIFDGARHDIAHVWDQIFSNTVGTVIRLGHNVETQFGGLRHGIATTFDGLRHDIAAAWDAIWNNTVGRVQRGVGDVAAWFRKLPGQILGALRGLGHTLGSFASAALTEFWNGFKNVAGNILHWLGGFLNSLVGLAKKILGVFSPSSVFFDIGKNMMLGLEGGIKAHARSAVSAARAAAQAAAGAGAHGGPASASAAQAQAYARSRLGAYGWSASQMGPLIALWMGESGWNRLARNPTSGAYGIPQALPASKMGAAANPPTSSAAAQINWGMGYIRSVYGDPANAFRLWLSRSPHWYGAGLEGGIFTQPTLIGVGERGPERVDISPAGSRGGGDTYNINVTVNVPVSGNPRETARQIADVLNQGAVVGVKLRRSILSANG